MSTDRDIASGIAEIEPAIRRLVREEAGAALLRFDSVSDLVQGAMREGVRAASGFEERGEDAFRAWVYQIARRHLNARREYWFACKRNAGPLLRLSLSGADRTIHLDPSDARTGPATVAFRREQMILMTRAIAMLMPRDRDIVTWVGRGERSPEIASRLGITDGAAEKARTRALERLRKAFTIIERSQIAPQDS